jgi:hypothetical protein
VLEWWLFAGVYLASLAFASVRLVSSHVRVERGRRTLNGVERDLKARAVRVKVVGAPGELVVLGHGDLWDLTARTFELQGPDGIITVASGARVCVVSPAASVQSEDKQAVIPAGTSLLYGVDPPEELLGHPHRTPGSKAYQRGDSLLLFAADAPLFIAPLRARQLSWPRFAGFLVLYLGALGLSYAGAPASAWNVLAFFVLGVLLLDHVFIKGSATSYLLATPPR